MKLKTLRDALERKRRVVNLLNCRCTRYCDALAKQHEPHCRCSMHLPVVPVPSFHVFGLCWSCAHDVASSSVCWVGIHRMARGSPTTCEFYEMSEDAKRDT